MKILYFFIILILSKQDILDNPLVQELYPKTAKLLKHFAEDKGLQFYPLDTSEFAKADGALTCMSLLW